VTAAATEPDDDALTWAGDERDAPAPPLTTEPADANRGIPAPLLVTYGVIAGIYLIYTLGWIITVNRSATTLPNLLGEIMFQFGEFLAIASPALWFVAVLMLTRGRPAVARLGWLLVGLVVVVPWPFVLGA
jgi:hypothetical protein